MTRKDEMSPLGLLDSLIGDTGEVRRAARRERLRLELAKVMKQAREEAGVTQKDVARALGVTQSWVSKLENANHDHKLESVLTYFDAFGAEMGLSVDVGTATFQIWGSPPMVSWEGYVPSAGVWSLQLDAPAAKYASWDWLDVSEPDQDTQTGNVVDMRTYILYRAEQRDCDGTWEGAGVL